MMILNNFFIEFDELLGENKILVCTDSASRGLDLPYVQHVIQAEFATNVVQYLHRIGRSSRAGKRGLATNFYDNVSEDLVNTILDPSSVKGIHFDPKDDNDSATSSSSIDTNTDIDTVSLQPTDRTKEKVTVVTTTPAITQAFSRRRGKWNTVFYFFKTFHIIILTMNSGLRQKIKRANRADDDTPSEPSDSDDSEHIASREDRPYRDIATPKYNRSNNKESNYRSRDSRNSAPISDNRDTYRKRFDDVSTSVKSDTNTADKMEPTVARRRVDPSRSTTASSSNNDIKPKESKDMYDWESF